MTNSPTSSHLQRFIEEKGGIQVRYISGYRNVINKALELNRLGKDTASHRNKRTRCIQGKLFSG